MAYTTEDEDDANEVFSLAAEVGLVASEVRLKDILWHTLLYFRTSPDTRLMKRITPKLPTLLELELSGQRAKLGTVTFTLLDIFLPARLISSISSPSKAALAGSVLASALTKLALRFDELTNDQPKASALHAEFMLIVTYIICVAQSKFVTVPIDKDSRPTAAMQLRLTHLFNISLLQPSPSRRLFNVNTPCCSNPPCNFLSDLAHSMPAPHRPPLPLPHISIKVLPHPNPENATLPAPSTLRGAPAHSLVQQDESSLDEITQCNSCIMYYPPCRSHRGCKCTTGTSDWIDPWIITSASYHSASYLAPTAAKMLPMLQFAPGSEMVPVLCTHSFSSLSQLLEVLDSIPDLHSIIGVLDEFEDEFDREREHLVSDTLPTALYTSYTSPVTANTNSVAADRANAGHTPTIESAYTPIQPTHFPKAMELPLSPSALLLFPSHSNQDHELITALRCQRIRVRCHVRNTRRKI
ncbi:hypothetical protein BDR03DRAFT_1019099 [Suillus americanus]|nr:hypothetical protein BDR03DRAFT_1019099 [Suillus americanus]